MAKVELKQPVVAEISANPQRMHSPLVVVDYRGLNCSSRILQLA